YATLVEAPKGGMDKLIDEAFAAHRKKRKLAASTIEQYEAAAKILKRKLSPFSPQQVLPRHVAKVMSDLAEHPNMANRVLRFLRTVFSYAVEWQQVDSNPCIGIRRQEEAKRMRLISAEEWWKLHAHAGPRLQVIMELQQLTGQRIGDVLKIRVGQISDAGIEFRQQKTKKPLLVAMTP